MTYDIYDIYKNIIKFYIINIDYYALTWIICKLYEEFIKYYIIVENHPHNLSQLFQEFKQKFNNHLIDEDSFFKQLNLIINTIKD